MLTISYNMAKVMLVSVLVLQLMFFNYSSRVDFLPGFDGPLPFKLETGYIGVDKGEDVQLFYYFFESENDPKNDPIMVWFTGGPGCSSISAILYENGPLMFEQVSYNGSVPKLLLNPNSWTKIASIIFIDLPVGTGFSYGRTIEASHSSDIKSSHNANEFLRKWLSNHPQFLQNPVYLGGDSYSGITVPVYFDEMFKGNEEGQQPFVNLKGYLLGNPGTDFETEYNYAIPFAHGMGLIPYELYMDLKTSCKGDYITVAPDNVACVSNLQAYQRCIAGIFPNHILEPLCGFEPGLMSVLRLGRSSMYQKSEQVIQPRRRVQSLGEFTCRADGYLLAYFWLNDPSVREAIHVQKGSIDEWTRCKYGVGLNYTSEVGSSLSYHVKLSTKGYRSLIYSGDHDMTVTFLGTQAWIRSLGYAIVDDWRSWWVDGQVAGYTRTYANRMTYATVKGAGHTAPEYKPKECATMFRRWISGEPL